MEKQDLDTDADLDTDTDTDFCACALEHMSHGCMATLYKSENEHSLTKKFVAMTAQSPIVIISDDESGNGQR